MILSNEIPFLIPLRPKWGGPVFWSLVSQADMASVAGWVDIALALPQRLSKPMFFTQKKEMDTQSPRSEESLHSRRPEGIFRFYPADSFLKRLRKCASLPAILIYFCSFSACMGFDAWHRRTLMIHAVQKAFTIQGDLTQEERRASLETQALTRSKRRRVAYLRWVPLQKQRGTERPFLIAALKPLYGMRKKEPLRLKTSLSDAIYFELRYFKEPLTDHLRGREFEGHLR